MALSAQDFTRVVRKLREGMAKEYPRVVRWPISPRYASVIWIAQKPMRKKIARMMRTYRHARCVIEAK